MFSWLRNLIQRVLRIAPNGPTLYAPPQEFVDGLPPYMMALPAPAGQLRALDLRNMRSVSPPPVMQASPFGADVEFSYGSVESSLC